MKTLEKAWAEAEKCAPEGMKLFHVGITYNGEVVRVYVNNEEVGNDRPARAQD